MTSSERRQIGQAIREYDHERDESGREMLARLAREYTPEKVPPDKYRVFNFGGTPNVVQQRPLTNPQPKPRKRIVDKKAIKQYVQEHPSCEIALCAETPCPEPHHLVSRKNYRKGDDVPANLLRLCYIHHTAWHMHGGKYWFALYHNNLTAESRSKVMAALRMDT